MRLLSCRHARAHRWKGSACCSVDTRRSVPTGEENLVLPKTFRAAAEIGWEAILDLFGPQGRRQGVGFGGLSRHFIRLPTPPPPAVGLVPSAPACVACVRRRGSGPHRMGKFLGPDPWASRSSRRTCARGGKRPGANMIFNPGLGVSASQACLMGVVCPRGVLPVACGEGSYAQVRSSDEDRTLGQVGARLAVFELRYPQGAGLERVRVESSRGSRENVDWAGRFRPEVCLTQPWPDTAALWARIWAMFRFPSSLLFWLWS